MTHTDFAQYEAYKDSGVEWLGEVPEHWKVKRLKDLGDSIIGITYSPNDVVEDDSEGTLVLRASNIQNGKLSLSDNVYVSNRIQPKHILRQGDILLCSRSGSRTLIGKNICIDEATAGCTFGAFMTVYRSRYFKFISKFFNSQIFESQSGLFASSTVNQLTINTLRNFTIALPPLPEQRAIAAYLDARTANLDRQITLLTQKAARYASLKQALINHTVTHGLDLAAPMKDSGIEWIGEIPAHWEIERAKALFRKMSRPVLDSDDIVTAFRDGEVTLRKNRRTEGFTNALKEIGYQGIRTGDLVIHAMDAFAGAIGVSDSNGKSSPVYSVYTAIDLKRVFIPYYGLLLRQMALSGFISSLAKGIRQRSTDFRHNQFAPLELPVPPLPEQRAIAAYLDAQTAHIDRIIETIKAKIAALQELRQTLINDVVTGKIKVV